jgi:hypothetical protein
MRGVEAAAAGIEALGSAAAETAAAVLAWAWVVFVLLYVLAATPRRSASSKSPIRRSFQDVAGEPRGTGAVSRRRAA